MTTKTDPGLRIAAGALLVAAGVAGEWVLRPQAPDGSVEDGLGFAAVVGISTVGALLLVLGISGVRRSRLRRTRPARIGAAVSVAGAVLLLVGFTAMLVTGLLAGTPHGASFLPYLLGMALMVVGPVTWGVSLCRQAGAAGLGQLLVAAGVAGAASLAIATDPWHDVALMTMLAAWAAAGLVSRTATARASAGSAHPPADRAQPAPRR